MEDDKEKVMTRQEINDLLIEDDYESIQVDAEYFYNIMHSGFKGYSNYTDKELLDEYYERTDDGTIVTIKKEETKDP